MKNELNYTPLKEKIEITKHNWEEPIMPMVSVLCFTYNHVTFIRKALDGFLMQKTDFPVEIIVHEDCSTDGYGGLKFEIVYGPLIKILIVAFKKIINYLKD